MNIVVSLEPNPVFLDAARTIAKGEPPPWLLIGLTHFSRGIGAGPADEYERYLKQTCEAVEVLQRLLPAFNHLPYGLGSPQAVTTVLNALPSLRRILEGGLRQNQNGRKPNVRRKICAAVVVEASKLLHRKTEPRSLSLQQGCNQYWLACGCEEIGAIGDFENWRRPLEQAYTNNHSWIRSILLHLQTSVAVQNPH